MRKISTKAEADTFYKLINEYIDDYINNWSVEPKNLKKYFQKQGKVENFLKRIGLDDVERIKTILNDVIDDRVAMSKDGIMKFENFEFTENTINFEPKLTKSDIEHEKVLADLFKVSLSQVIVTNEDTHTYTVDDFGTEHRVCILSKKDLNDTKMQLVDWLVDTIKKQEIDFDNQLAANIFTGLRVSMSSIIDNEKMKSKLEKELTTDKICNIVTNWLNTEGEMAYEYYKTFYEHHIWIVSTQ